MISKERTKVQWQMEAFQTEFDDYHENFRNNEIFLFETGSDQAYDIVDGVYQNILEMEKKTKDIQAQEEMLEITKHDYEKIPHCRTDHVLVKTVWDIDDMVCSQLDEWKKTQ
jgi:hypothetical protein